MTFSLWCRVVLGASPLDPKLAAQMHNLVTEDRVAEIKDVKDQMGCDFGSRAPQDLASARKTVEAAQLPLRLPDCSLLGLIPSTSDDHKAYEAVSFVTGTQIERQIIPTFKGRDKDMPERVPLPARLFARYPRRFLWATFRHEVEGLIPTDIALALGLPHFLAGETVYRIPLGDWPDDVYIPTCMDSGIFEAWMRPPAGHNDPWGMTRHLATGLAEKPELLVQVEDVERKGLIAERVGPNGLTVTSFAADYLIGRDLAICRL